MDLLRDKADILLSAITNEVHFAIDLKSTGVMFDAQCKSAGAPQHFLNFLPLPQGTGSLRPTFA
jgi:hypothetical protein